MPSEVFDSYKKIAFVRNPWDRMVSNFEFKTKGTDIIARNSNDSFEDFIRAQFKSKKTVQEMIGIEPVALPTLNASKRAKAYQDYYTLETKELVANYYQKDIDSFGYTF